MSEPAARIRAGIYSRQSHSKEKSLEEQDQDNETACRDHGWSVTWYRDGVSASRFSRKARDEWPKVLKAIENLEIDYLVLWESSRGDRKLTDWSQLLDLCRDLDVKIYVTERDRTYDMADPNDWKTLANDGVDSAYESEKISRRTLRGVRGNAAIGRPHGPKRYGYQRRYEMVKGRMQMIEQLPDPTTAAIVNEIIRRAGRADPIVMITNDLNSRGVPSPRGGRWHRQVVRAIAMDRAYIGKNVLNGEEYEASWSPIVSEADFYAAQRVLTDPKRVTTKPGRVKHRLAYLATCGKCGNPLHANLKKTGVSYSCHVNGCVSVKAEWLDRFIRELIIDRLADPKVWDCLANDDLAATAARDEVTVLQRQLDDFYDQAADGKLSATGLARVEARLLSKIEEAEHRVAQVTSGAPYALRSLTLVTGTQLVSPDPRVQLTNAWDALSVAAQKELIRGLFASIKVKPATRTGRRGTSYHEDFDQGRIEFHWMDLGAEAMADQWKGVAL